MTVFISIFGISDIHTDYQINSTWLENLAIPQHTINVLIVAGDVSEDETILQNTFGKLLSLFDVVAFVPGNHDVWISDNGCKDSAVKYNHIRSSLQAMGAYVRPFQLEILNSDGSPDQKHLFVPIHGWHTPYFDMEPDVDPASLGLNMMPTLNNVVKDLRKCRWPPSIQMLDDKRNRKCRCLSTQLCGGSRCCRCNKDYLELCVSYGCVGGDISTDWSSDLIAESLDSFNDQDPVEPPPNRELVKGQMRIRLKDTGDVVQNIWKNHEHMNNFELPQFDVIVSFSHFLPFPMLNPEKRYLFYPPLPKVIGSQYLGVRTLQLLPSYHVFGHTHFGWLARLDQLKTNKVATKSKILETKWIQAPLAYPREHNTRARSLYAGSYQSVKSSIPYRIYSIESALDGRNYKIAENDNDDALWSNHYRTHRRNPMDIEPAPYVRQVYQSFH